jgi:hypothetical protein
VKASGDAAGPASFRAQTVPGRKRLPNQARNANDFSAPGKGEQPESMVKEFRIGPQRSWSVVAFTIMTAAGFQSVGDR